ncbi:MAG: protein kinase [Parabacteroides sp.]|nr:protein kinase [Parabacteroides sp.]
MQQLKSGSLLQGGKYKIEKVLGQGGFGITYLAIQELLDRKVCIKEFFFKEYCERDEATSHVTLGTQSNREMVERFMNKFLKEARTISQLHHPNIIQIYDIFKENNTAYYVMEYIEGESLADMVKWQGALPEIKAVEYIRQTATALEFIHLRSINHLDVKPSNIMVRKEEDKVVLIDFGLSKQYDVQGAQTSTTPVGISQGYAPMEQYNAGGVSTFSPQSDIYSLGATFYKLVTGTTPPQAIDVFNEGLPELPTHLSSSTVATIKRAMQPGKKKRPASIAALMTFLDGTNNDHADKEETQVIVTEPILTPKSQPEPIKPDVQSVSQQKTSKDWLWPLIVGVLAALAVIFWPKSEEASIKNATTSVATNSSISGTINGHDYVDLGLSVKWATCNVGASSPSDYGDYFAWGETSPKYSYTRENSVTYKKNIGDIAGNARYDAARANWGSSWRLPTGSECQELVDRCTWTWTTQGGHEGYKVTGRNGNSIFLPAAGWRNGSSLDNAGEYGRYWSSLPGEDNTDAYNLLFDSGCQNVFWYYRSLGRSVRPVSE